jgi:hypothetical protein
MKTLLTLIILIAFPLTVFGQGAFLEKGQSGFGVGADLVTNDDLTALGGSVGYSVSGIFDFGFSVYHSGFEEKFYGEDLSAISLSPSVSFYPVKQNENTPISLSLDAGYEWDKYSNDILRKLDLKMNGNYFSMGVSLFGYVRADKLLKVQPVASISYVTGNTKIKDNYGNNTYKDDHVTIFGLGLSLIFDTSPGTIFVITPRISTSEEVTSFGLALAFVIPTKSN